MALGNEQSGFFNGGSSGGSSSGVPYTGATQDVDLGEFGLDAGFVQLDTTPTYPTSAVGKIVWNQTDGTINLGLMGGNVVLQVGQEEVVRVVNKSGGNLTQAGYQAVRILGSQGQRLSVALAQGNNDANSQDTLGLVTENIAINQEGFITSSGLVRDINTTGSLQGETWAEGDLLFLSPTTAGRLTNIPPTAPQHSVRMGYVISSNPSNGSIFVKVDNGYEIGELHDVYVPSPSNNDTIAWNSSTLRYENNNVATLLGQASSITDGYLSSTDWNTFNDKQNALANPITGVGLSNNLTYFTNTNSIANLSTTTYPSLTEISYVKGVTSAIQTQIDNKPSNNSVVSAYQGLGSTVKAVPIGLNLSLNIAISTQFSNQRLWLMPVYLSATATITGVKWYQSAIGNYTANNYNGVGLYSVSGGTITLIASSTNDGTIWQTFATGTWGNKAFSSPITNLVAGTYFIGALWNSSASVTTPAIQTFTSSAIGVQAFDFTGGRLACILATQLTLPSPLTLSTTTGVATSFWFSLY